jgi:dephospho-CoA kinase
MSAAIRIGLTGYSRTGKDEVGRILVSCGFKRVALGDEGKRELDVAIRQHFGFSAFTEVDEEKQQIRRILEEWITARFEPLMTELIRLLPHNAVNTKILRPEEAERWRAAGGVIWHVTRPGEGPKTPNELVELGRMWKADLVDRVIENNGTLQELEDKVIELLATF